MSFNKKLLAIFFILCASPCYALAKVATVQNIVFNNKQNLEITVDKKVEFKAYILHKPERLVIDITNAEFDEQTVAKPRLPSFISGFRKSKERNILRLVFIYR